MLETSHIAFFLVNQHKKLYKYSEREHLVNKANAKQNPVKTAEREGKKAAKQAAYSPLMERLTRLGYAVKGFLYVAIGFIAIAGALGKSKTPADQFGAINTFARLPNAEILLWIFLIGFISYSLWGVIRAVLDPLHKGTDIKGLLTRAGYLVSAATYASLGWVTYEMIRGVRHAASSNSTVQMVSKIMSMPMGRWLVGAIGVAAILAGLYQIYSGIKQNYDEVLKPYALSPEQLRIARQVGRYGTIARGIVFALVGFFFALAAWQANPGHAQGFNGALKYLEKQPYGIYLLLIVALGLIAFGIYSFMSAAWFRPRRQAS